ncbi:MAG: hypothetical protein JSU03_02985 [Bacteroidetes bacterium]|nr:hypothetical protein [Bacteroidota bacterium]MBS1756222.1 hypothetical protein [Bacteroidota bacterium]
MKNYRLLTLLILLFTVSLTASKCKKDKTPDNPVEALPPETQTGANTFGCLINGKVFLPQGQLLSGPFLKCAYQYLNNTYSKGYFFQLSASDESNSSDVFGVGIFTDSLALTQGLFPLIDNQKGNAYGTYFRFNYPSSTTTYTKNNLPGILTITKFDEINQIVSGTFWFSVIKSPGDTIKVTDGRFDMQFTK